MSLNAATSILIPYVGTTLLNRYRPSVNGIEHGDDRGAASRPALGKECFLSSVLNTGHSHRSNILVLGGQTGGAADGEGGAEFKHGEMKVRRIVFLGAAAPNGGGSRREVNHSSRHRLPSWIVFGLGARRRRRRCLGHHGSPGRRLQTGELQIGPPVCGRRWVFESHGRVPSESVVARIGRARGPLLGGS